MQIREYERAIMERYRPGGPTVDEQVNTLAVELAFLTRRANLLGYSLEELASRSWTELEGR